MTPDCSNHRKDVFGEHDMKKLAEEIGDLHYEALGEFLLRLKEKIQHDSTKDKEAGRYLLANKLWVASGGIYTAYVNVTIASSISKPFMDNKKHK